MFLRSCLAALMILPPAGALAHPHLFIDAGLELVYDDQGALSQVAVEWRYDAFYSLLIVEDLGLDPDGDGILTPQEEAAAVRPARWGFRSVRRYRPSSQGRAGQRPARDSVRPAGRPAQR